MNEFKNSPIEKTIQEVAEDVQPNLMFTAELEAKLRQAHKPRKTFQFPFRSFVPVATSIVILGALMFFMLWLLRSLNLQPAPANIPVSEEAPTSESALSSNTTFEYEVQEGDTCSMLAERHGISVEELMELNGLNECTIFIGMKLRLPVIESATPPPQEGGYDWRGTTLYLDAALPETPSDVKIYQAQTEIAATVEDARAFAQRFNLTGEIYQVSGELPNTTNYLIVDDNRQLRIRSDGYFSYIVDGTAWGTIPFFETPPNAESLIADFMQTYGFDFPYIIEYSKSHQGYFALPLTPDGFPIKMDSFAVNGLLFRFNKNRLLAVEANLLKYNDVINATVISAEEAFQGLLSGSGSYGSNETMIMGGAQDVQNWSRSRPLDQSIRYFGWLKATGLSIDGNPPLITLDGYTVTGNLADIAPNTENIFIEAVGSFHEENGVKTFVMESWNIYEGYEEGIQGRVEREGDQVFIAVLEGPKLLLPDFPADIPLPIENVFLVGVTRDNVFEWKTMDTRTQSGGGGGGGGGGFYKVNVSGTPIPFPPTATPAPEAEFSPQAFEAMRGIVSVTLYIQSDGSERTEYTFITDGSFAEYPYMVLEGEGLEELKAYHNLPIDIWGRVDRINENGLPVATVERFEAPFPDLSSQILKGKANPVTVNGEELLVFVTEENQQYVLINSNGSTMIDNGLPQDTLIFVEGLTIPDEMYAGYSALRMFGMGMALNPDTGEEFEYLPSAGAPNEIPDFAAAPNTTITATITQIELVYYIPDPRYSLPEQGSDPLYIQSAWRFHGQYSDGSQFEILIQALTQEFLLPEFEESVPPG